jgi:Protein of unknown function (DUF3800)
MDSHIFLDESGDLGFSFHKKYRIGGSSRHLTIGYLLCPVNKSPILRRVAKDVYTKFGFKIGREKKATELKPKQKVYICNSVVDLINKNPDFLIGAITVKKERVMDHIRSDPNKLYNYMMRLSILDKIKGHDKSKLTRDERSIKVASGNSCIDYLQSIMWFDYRSATALEDNPCPSHHDDGIILADWLTNFIWGHYEDSDSDAFNIISSHLRNQTLYF